MKFKSNARYGDPVESGTIFEGKIGNIRISVHRIMELMHHTSSCRSMFMAVIVSQWYVPPYDRAAYGDVSVSFVHSILSFDSSTVEKVMQTIFLFEKAQYFQDSETFQEHACRISKIADTNKLPFLDMVYAGFYIPVPVGIVRDLFSCRSCICIICSFLHQPPS